MPQPKSPTASACGEESPYRNRLPLRDESAARQSSPRGNPYRAAEPDRVLEVEESHGRVQPWRFARRHRASRGRAKLLPGGRSGLQLKVLDPCESAQIRGRFLMAKKKTGLVGPASSSVELRCGYITARRMLAPKVPPALFLARSVRMKLLAQ